MSPAFSPTRYVISTRRKAKRELLLLPAMNDTIGQLDQPECCPTFQRDNLHRHFRVRVFSIGAGWCQALSDCSVDPGFDVARRVLASLRDRHSGPPMMGSEGCGGPISRYVLAVRLTAGIKTRNGLASSIVPAGTSLHRVGGIQFSPIAIVHN